MQVMTKKANNYVNSFVNPKETANGLMIDADIVSAKGIYTKSKTPDFSNNYIDYFYMDNVDTKNTHFANINENYLDMEERVVALEGFATQLLQELCLENPTNQFCSDTIIEDSVARIKEFVQPTGAHDAYSIGDKVKWKNNYYESKIDANVWGPSAYPAGWEVIS
jgi:hypothetical protein